VVQTGVWQIQNGGWLPFHHFEKWPYLSNGLTDLHEIWRGDSYWLAEGMGSSDFKLLKIPDGRRRSLKWKNGHISATVWPISAKFGVVTHTGPPNRSDNYIFELLKIEDGGRPPSWKIKKQPFLGNGLMYLHENWHGNAYWPSKRYGQLKFYNIKNPWWRMTSILKNGKMAISRPWYDRSVQNLVWWHVLALQTIMAVKILNF